MEGEEVYNVDFSEGLTTTKSPDIYIKLTILQRRYDLLNLFYIWRKNTANIRVKHDLVACLETLFFEVEASMRRRLENLKADSEEGKRYQAFFKLIDEGFNTDVELIQSISTINYFFDMSRLTRIDSRKQYDRTDVESENYEKGL